LSSGEENSESLFAYHGKRLVVDVSNGISNEIEIERKLFRQFLGGVGLGTAIHLQHRDDRVEALDSRSMLTFCFSPLVGSALTTSAKFAVVYKSPLTGRLNDAMAGSSFALAGKRTGFDAISIVGKADSPVVVVIDGRGDRASKISLVDATEYVGLGCTETEAKLKERFDVGFEFAVVGPAGENLVRYATISHGGRHAGRGGSGAVMGSKNIKAIAVAGDKQVKWFDRQRLVELSRELSKKSLGPATKKYRELGTVENLTTFNRLGALPTRNFQAGSFEDAERLAPQSLGDVAEKTRASCAACTIGCEHIYQVRKPSGHSPSSNPAGSVTSETNGNVKARMEYESLFALGPLCGISDPETVIQAAKMCDEFGIDTISMGASIAFAMECSERGYIDERLEFGNGQQLIDLIGDTATINGFGKMLSEGTREMSRRIGRDSAGFAPHVKGLEIPGYEPRALKTMSLGFAVQTRGADHNRSGAYESDFSENGNRLEIDENSAGQAIETEDRAALIDSMILCKFVRRVFDDFYSESAEMLRLVTGWKFDAQELKGIAERIVNAKKLYNIRSGWTEDEDTLPARFFEQNAGEFNQKLNREHFVDAVKQYFELRGWEYDGTIGKALLQQLDLDRFNG